MVKAYAKINVALNVYERKEDGYHNLDMVMLPIELHDRIEFEFLPDHFDTLITCDDETVAMNENNLMTRAYNVLLNHYHFKQKFRIHCHKVIPISAGLGGGSSNAAAVIITILKMLKIKPSYEELISLAKEVGADVPFCLFNKPCRVRGIGEQLDEIKIKNHYYVLLIKPKQGISTRDAYEKFDTLQNVEYSNIEELIHGLKIGDDELIAKNMKNGLEQAGVLLLNDIKEIKNKLLNDGFPLTLMSGSGSSVFALSTSLKDLQNEAAKFDKNKYTIKLTSIL